MVYICLWSSHFEGWSWIYINFLPYNLFLPCMPWFCSHRRKGASALEHIVNPGNGEKSGNKRKEFLRWKFLGILERGVRTEEMEKECLLQGARVRHRADVLNARNNSSYHRIHFDFWMTKSYHIMKLILDFTKFTIASSVRHHVWEIYLASLPHQHPCFSGLIVTTISHWHSD